MWTAITAAVVMAGLIVLARIAERALGARERAADVAELAEQMGHAYDAVCLQRGELDRVASRLDDAESTLAALKTQAATRGRR